MNDIEKVLAETLGPHWRTDCSESPGDGTYVRWVRCRCGWQSEASSTLVNAPDLHAVWNDHLAAALAPLIAAREAAALREAGRVFAEGEWSDAFMEGNVEDDVSAARTTEAWLRDRADRIAP